MLLLRSTNSMSTWMWPWLINSRLFAFASKRLPAKLTPFSLRRREEVGVGCFCGPSISLAPLVSCYSSSLTMPTFLLWILTSLGVSYSMSEFQAEYNRCDMSARRSSSIGGGGKLTSPHPNSPHLASPHVVLDIWNEVKNTVEVFLF